MNELAVKYTNEQGEEIKLTGQDVVKYISTDSSVTEKEVVAFLKMCQYLKVNPFLKEIYLIKYRGAPATFVVSYQTLLKRAEGNRYFDGYETELKGELPDLTATAVVYRKDRAHPVKVTVHYSEAVKTVIDKRTGEMRPMSMWRNMPRWMLRKVALARALKEAFPTAIGNALVKDTEIVDIDTGDKRIQKEIKAEDGQKSVDDLYGVSEKEEKERSLRKTLYETLKEKKIDTIAKVKELLKNLFPDDNWKSTDKNVFEEMQEGKLEKVLDYIEKENAN